MRLSGFLLGNLLVLHAQGLHDLPLIFPRSSFGGSFTLLALGLVLDDHLCGKKSWSLVSNWESQRNPPRSFLPQPRLPHEQEKLEGCQSPASPWLSCLRKPAMNMFLFLFICLKSLIITLMGIPVTWKPKGNRHFLPLSLWKPTANSHLEMVKVWPRCSWPFM